MSLKMRTLKKIKNCDTMNLILEKSTHPLTWPHGGALRAAL